MRKRTLILSGALLAGAAIVGFAGGSGAAALDGAVPAAGQDTSLPEVRTTAIAVPPTSTEQQQGIVMEGTGAADGLEVMVTLYENSRYGNSLQVVIGDPELGRIGYVEQSDAFVVDGTLDAEVMVDGKVASLTGTVERTGQPTRTVEPMQDAGEQIVTRGTHTQLATDVALRYDGTDVPVDFAPAFAFDLQTRSTTLYGR